MSRDGTFLASYRSRCLFSFPFFALRVVHSLLISYKDGKPTPPHICTLGERMDFSFFFVRLVYLIIYGPPFYSPSSRSMRTGFFFLPICELAASAARSFLSASVRAGDLNLSSRLGNLTGRDFPFPPLLFLWA